MAHLHFGAAITKQDEIAAVFEDGGDIFCPRVRCTGCIHLFFAENIHW